MVLNVYLCCPAFHSVETRQNRSWCVKSAHLASAAAIGSTPSKRRQKQLSMPSPAFSFPPEVCYLLLASTVAEIEHLTPIPPACWLTSFQLIDNLVYGPGSTRKQLQDTQPTRLAPDQYPARNQLDPHFDRRVWSLPVGCRRQLWRSPRVVEFRIIVSHGRAFTQPGNGRWIRHFESPWQKRNRNQLQSPAGFALIEIGDVGAHSPHTLAGPTFHMSL